MPGQRQLRLYADELIKKSERILRHKEPDVNRLKYFEEEKLNGRHGRPKPRRLGMQIQIGMDSEI